MNRLYFGDNLKWLSDRKEFPDGSVDLVYLDPPFNSNADYNVLFREPSGQGATPRVLAELSRRLIITDGSRQPI
jgi:16S rRNA G966 N2-methylase RsmD